MLKLAPKLNGIAKELKALTSLSLFCLFVFLICSKSNFV